jgi:hypothetical protein
VSDSNYPGDIPPDLPPEYAEAYRRGYERAYGGQAARPSQRAAPSELGGLSDPPANEPTSLLSIDDLLVREQEPEPTVAVDLSSGPEHRPWLVPGLLGGLALLLIISAYGLGRLFSDQVAGTESSTNQPEKLVMTQHGGQSSGPVTHGGKAYGGRVEAVTVRSATASCQAASSYDAAGNSVGYDPSNVSDGDMTTAWRCDGNGYGQRLSLTLPGQVSIGEVGLVPGYAKTDPTSGANRYSENNRITKVRWTFSDGSSVVQRFNPSAHDRAMQTMRIPPVRADGVTIEILGSRPGPRDTIAVSEVRIGQAVH